MKISGLSLHHICAPAFFCFGLLFASIPGAHAQGIYPSFEQIIAKAYDSIRTNKPSTVNDISVLITTLRTSTSMVEQTELIEALRDIGDAQGSSPQSVKAYLKDIMPLALLDVLRSRSDGRVRGQALMSLRSFEPGDDILDQAISIAENDTSADRDYVHAQAKLLRQWKQDGKPAIAAPEKTGATDPLKQKAGETFLHKRSLEVSYHALVDAAAELDLNQLEALLDAGLRVGDVHVLAAHQAVAFGLPMACIKGKASPDKVEAFFRNMLKHGFRMDASDASGNELVMSTVQVCPTAVIVQLIDLGARADPVNHQDFTPLAMSMISAKWDLARILIDRGAGLSKKQVDSMYMELPDDPTQLELIKRAMQNKTK